MRRQGQWSLRSGNRSKDLGMSAIDRVVRPGNLARAAAFQIVQDEVAVSRSNSEGFFDADLHELQ
jgi:hypothetical protein